MINFNYNNHTEKDRATLTINDANVIDVIDSTQFYIASVIATIEKYASDEEELDELMSILVDAIADAFENEAKKIGIVNSAEGTDTEGFNETIKSVMEKLGEEVKK